MNISGWKCAPVLGFVFLNCVAVGAIEPAAVTANAIPESAATEGATTPYLYPPMDPADAITGSALVGALKKGGFVLYMRHTETGTVTKECNMSNLTPRGERDAARVGNALRTLGIPIARIASSPVCRVQDTARSLGLGAFDVVDALSNVPPNPHYDLNAARGKLLSTTPMPGKNLLLVSHMQSGNKTSDMLYLDFGEIIVFKPDNNDGPAALARVRVDDWASQFLNNKNISGAR
jgi:phosphohistidine phosphatase SixA